MECFDQTDLLPSAGDGFLKFEGSRRPFHTGDTASPDFVQQLSGKCIAMSFTSTSRPRKYYKRRGPEASGVRARRRGSCRSLFCVEVPSTACRQQLSAYFFARTLRFPCRPRKASSFDGKRRRAGQTTMHKQWSNGASCSGGAVSSGTRRQASRRVAAPKLQVCSQLPEMLQADIEDWRAVDQDDEASNASTGSMSWFRGRRWSIFEVLTTMCCSDYRTTTPGSSKGLEMRWASLKDR